MHVCLCTGPTGADVDAAAAAGIGRSGMVHAACGRVRDCGRSLPRIGEILGAPQRRGAAAVPEGAGSSAM